jgi:hypothetical protein
VIKIHRTRRGVSAQNRRDDKQRCGSGRANEPQKRKELRILCFEEVDIFFWVLDASPAARKSFTEA